MNIYQHIDYIADRGLNEWFLYGLAWLRDCVWECVCGAVLIALAVACVIEERINKGRK